MSRPSQLLVSTKQLAARVTRIPQRLSISHLRSLTQSSCVTPTFFRKQGLLLRYQTRAASQQTPILSSPRRHPYVRFGVRLIVSSVLGVGVLVGAILFHDAFTYSERHVDRVPANPLALHPRTGGKKNLPILEVNLDEEEEESKRSMKGKPRLVIIGGGWGVRSSLVVTFT